MKKEDEFNKPKLSKELCEIFTEMFSYVGAPFTQEFVNQPDWYKKYSWTEKDEYRFRKWLLEYMKAHRKELFGRKVSVAMVKHEIPWFMLNYSWTYKKPESDQHTESTFSSDQVAWTKGAEDL